MEKLIYEIPLRVMRVSRGIPVLLELQITEFKTHFVASYFQTNYKGEFIHLFNYGTGVTSEEAQKELWSKVKGLVTEI